MPESPRLLLVLIALATLLALPMNATGEPKIIADLVIVNAKIWTNDAMTPEATALACRDGLIVAVGDDQAVRSMIGDETKIIDANGARTLPGLIDAHAHLESAGKSLGWLALRDVTSKRAMLEMVHDAAAELDDGAWIYGRGWSAEGWDDPEPPTADELGSAAGGHPTILVRMDGHQLLASRRALELAGIDETTQSPPGGKIGKLPNGQPSGEIYEEAQALIYRVTPNSRKNPELSERALVAAATECVRNGITQVGAIESPDAIEAMARLDAKGQLPIRVGATVHISDDTIDEWRPVLEWALRNRNMSNRVKVLGFKGFVDGSLGSRTAWMMSPYDDNPHDEDPNNAGFPLAMAGDGTMPELILLGASMGLQPIMHAIGTRANNELLNWYEQIPENTRRRIRPRVEHAQHVLDADIERFAQLGVIPSMQPLHKADDGRYAGERMSAARLRSSYAFRDFVDQEAGLAFGSDWPVVSVNPFLGIHAAVSAQTMDGGTFLPEQSITVEESLRAYTTGASKALHSETYTGALRVGWSADLIILDRDILDESMHIDDVKETTVTTTTVGGEVVYSAN